MKLSWLLLFIPSLCVADGIGGHSLNNVPLFWGMVGNDPKYHDAAFKAQEAFFIQTGVAANYSMLTGYITSEANKNAKVAERTIATSIDDNTPLNSKQVFFALGMGYAIGIKKEVTQKFRNPLFPSINQTITVGQGHGSVGLQMPF